MSFTVGFSSLAESVPSVAYRTNTLKDAAQAAGINLIVRDNDMDDVRAMQNVQEFAEMGVDVAIIFHIHERLGDDMRKVLLKEQIPIIAVDIPIRLTTYFGANNAQAGQITGDALGDWIENHWQKQLDKILILTDSRVVSIVRDRVATTVSILRARFKVEDDDIFYIDSNSQHDISIQRTTEVFHRWHADARIAVIGVNDESALGALEAVYRLGRQQTTILSGQGASEAAVAKVQIPTSPFISTVDYHLGEYGSQLINLAQRIYNGEKVPPMNYIDHQIITKR